MQSQDNVPLSPAAQDLVNDDVEKLKNDFLGGVSWFYWIGGLSLVNLGFMALAERKFILGLGFSEAFYAIGVEGNSPAPWIVAAALISALFIGLGFMGRKGKKGFILGGLIFYALDAGLLLLADDFLSVVFHAYAGFMIFRGYRALGKIAAAGKAAASALADGGAVATDAADAAKAPADVVRTMPEEKRKTTA